LSLDNVVIERGEPMVKILFIIGTLRFCLNGFLGVKNKIKGLSMVNTGYFKVVIDRVNFF